LYGANKERCEQYQTRATWQFGHKVHSMAEEGKESAICGSK
jgi:hypothetical protein